MNSDAQGKAYHGLELFHRRHGGARDYDKECKELIGARRGGFHASVSLPYGSKYVNNAYLGSPKYVPWGLLWARLQPPRARSGIIDPSCWGWSPTGSGEIISEQEGGRCKLVKRHRVGSLRATGLLLDPMQYCQHVLVNPRVFFQGTWNLYPILF